jgi:uncharacterized protein (TIGR03000 family)
MSYRISAGIVIVSSLALPGYGLAQQAAMSIPALPKDAEPPRAIPTGLLPGTLVSLFPKSESASAQTALAATAENQLPLPIALQTAGNSFPVAELPQTGPNGEKAPLTIREPGDRFRKPEGEPGYPEAAFGNGHWHWSGWCYGPRVAPSWEYPGLGGGPKVIYPWGMPGYTGKNDSCSLNKTCRLWGPPVPVYSPVPEPNNTKDLIYPGRNISSPGFVYGWVGPFPASPRYKHYAVSSWAQPGTDLSTGGPNSGSKNPGASGDAKKPGGYLSLSVKVPDPSAELFVDGIKTTQSGLERTFCSPELEAGKEYRYELTVRWQENRATYERKKIVIGSSGETIPLDFTATEVVRAEK